jgi:hypothetical protein
MDWESISKSGEAVIIRHCPTGGYHIFDYRGNKLTEKPLNSETGAKRFCWERRLKYKLDG